MALKILSWLNDTLDAISEHEWININEIYIEFDRIQILMCLQLQLAIGIAAGVGLLLIILVVYCWKRNRR